MQGYKEHDEGLLFSEGYRFCMHRLGGFLWWVVAFPLLLKVPVAGGEISGVDETSHRCYTL